MDKILISLDIPSISEKYDVFVQTNIEIKTLIAILANGVHDLSNGRYGSSGKELLINQNPLLLLDPNKTLNDYNIKDGAKLVMI